MSSPNIRHILKLYGQTHGTHFMQIERDSRYARTVEYPEMVR